MIRIIEQRIGGASSRVIPDGTLRVSSHGDDYGEDEAKLVTLFSEDGSMVAQTPFYGSLLIEYAEEVGR